MIRADFYLIDASAPQAGWQLACRLLDKAYQQKAQALVLCPDQGTAEQMDELLWTYKDDSFIPHNLIGDGPNKAPPIQIAWDGIPGHHRNILLQCTPALPEGFERFKRLLFVVVNDEALRADARAIYKQLREAGATLNVHEM